ncbi:MAG: sucrose phosphorylase [Pseudohongiella sp.]|nr:MAG: sucrose phosphorylase [Pseudohongiella sp.]
MEAQEAQQKELIRRVAEHLNFIYPDQNNEQLTERLIAEMSLGRNLQTTETHQNNWDETDSILITYGNTVMKDGELPLHTLHRFLNKHLAETIKCVHILPFFPFSSDDGFSVMDFLQVNPWLGDWEDIEAIGKDYRLMSDLVINHMSSRSRWFDNFKKRLDPGKDYFAEGKPDDDYSQVVRPRNSPLLTPIATADGERHVWCTFSADQVDLNFKNPEVLLEFVRIIRKYLNHGVAIFRLDAVAFLWKEAGTSCIHLQQTHEIIKLLRTLIEHYFPDVILICECNVPNRENLTYFGNANEAHIIYNFSLPPLLLYTLLSGDCRHLKTWMMSMPPAQSGTSYLNFIASHDGIGLRPLDGLLAESERDKLVDTIQKFGGRVTYRKAREGHDKPYELNVALYDALKGTIESGEDEFAYQRFICAHAIMLALEGIPGIYIQSLFGSRNDHSRLEHTGRPRSINRNIWKESELEEELEDANSMHGKVFSELNRLLRIRQKQAAFHPNATQFTLHLGQEIFGFWRQSIDRSQSVFSLSNVSSQSQLLNLADINLISTNEWRDLIGETPISDLGGQLELSPYQTLWITNSSSS